jgi:hypoxanthine phosphoribosyltransferase
LTDKTITSSAGDEPTNGQSPARTRRSRRPTRTANSSEASSNGAATMSNGQAAHPGVEQPAALIPASAAPDGNITPTDAAASPDGEQTAAPRRRRRRPRRPAAAPEVVTSTEDNGQVIPTTVEQPAALIPASAATEGNAALTNEQNVAPDVEQPAAPKRRRRNTSKEPAVAVPMPHLQVPTTHRPFPHPSEGEIAGVLDFYGVKWLYEPRSFPLRWDGDRIVEMFTPDFYLTELDMYLELTTMKQSLVTEKNRKLRHIRELYPEINIKLLYRRDIHRILAKYGIGPLVQEDIPEVSSVLFSKDKIEQRVGELGREISRNHEGQPLLLVGVLRGVFCFMADLMRQITLPLSMDFMSVSYYSGEGGENGGVHVTKGTDIDIAGRHVLLVEDIVDTGMTLNYLIRYLESQKPANLEVCALLDKRVRRIADVKLNYVGFEIPDEFIVGYGLDYMERYRNLPYIGILRPGEQPQPATRRRRRPPRSPATQNNPEQPGAPVFP